MMNPIESQHVQFNFIFNLTHGRSLWENIIGKEIDNDQTRTSEVMYFLLSFTSKANK